MKRDVRVFGGGVMNNNLLLLPGRAINTQLANAPPRAAIRLVTHRHDICFPRVECAGYYECHLPTTDIGSIVVLYVVYRDCFSAVSASRERERARPLCQHFGPVDIPPRVPSLLISLLTESRALSPPSSGADNGVLCCRDSWRRFYTSGTQIRFLLYIFDTAFS